MVFAYQSVGFQSQKQKKNKYCHPKMVTPGADRGATVLHNADDEA